MNKEEKIIAICETMLSMKDDVTSKDLDFALREIRSAKFWNEVWGAKDE